MTFGFFNVITAIYVDNTLTAAKIIDQKQAQMRLLDQKLVDEKLVELLQFIWKKTMSRNSSLNVESAREIQITPLLYEQMRQCEEFQSILNSLDISAQDQVDIFETLDVDGSGSIDLDELIIGIPKMRGDARRSDVVGIMLMVRHLMDKLDRISVKIGSCERAKEKPVKVSNDFESEISI